jgi:hypothetical protein
METTHEEVLMRSNIDSPPFSFGPSAMLRAAMKAVPAMRYALGIGGLAAVVAVVLTAWKLPPGTAIIGSLLVLVGMVVLVIFAALSATKPTALRPLAMSMAWSFLVLTVATATLFLMCAFFNTPQSLQCLLQGCGASAVTSPDKTVPTAIRNAASILEMFYARNYEKVYDQFSPTVRQAYPFAQFRAIAQKNLRQLGNGPLRRQVRGQPKAEGGYLFVPFDAEFDENAKWIEGVTFVSTDSGWALFGIDMQPAAWTNATGTSKVLSEPDAATAIRNQGQNAVGYWTPPRGWRATVERTVRRTERTCDVTSTAGAVRVNARNVLGGCQLTPGTTIDLLGQVVNVGADNIDLDGIRYQVIEN